jgi:hypothetical protein
VIVRLEVEVDDDKLGEADHDKAASTLATLLVALLDKELTDWKLPVTSIKAVQ